MEKLKNMAFKSSVVWEYFTKNRDEITAKWYGPGFSWFDELRQISLFLFAIKFAKKSCFVIVPYTGGKNNSSPHEFLAIFRNFSSKFGKKYEKFQ